MDEQRKRIARALHGGRTQDLAYISMESQRLAERDPVAPLLLAPPPRRIARSRGAIVQLRATDDSLSTAVPHVAVTLTDRAGSDCIGARRGGRGRRRSARICLGIVSDAINNAVRHSGASAIKIQPGQRPRFTPLDSRRRARVDPDLVGNGQPRHWRLRAYQHARSRRATRQQAAGEIPSGRRDEG